MPEVRCGCDHVPTFPQSGVNMELKSKTDSGFAITSGARSQNSTGKTNGGVEVKIPVNHTAYTVPFTLKVPAHGGIDLSETAR